MFSFFVSACLIVQESFEDALIMKRFYFEAFDCYIPLVYLAFVQVLKNQESRIKMMKELESQEI